MTRRARAAALVLCLAAAASSCATSTETSAGGPVWGDDASTDARPHADAGGGGPSPDAIVSGDDGPAGDDATYGKSCTGLPDGTPCGPAPDFCHDAAQCMGGACAAPAAKPDGTTCGKAPDVCHVAPVCTGGTCAAPANVPDGTTCGTAPDVCHVAPVCSGGTCAPPADVPDGTVCANAPDACHTDGTCAAGKCGAVGKRADGYDWSGGADATAICCNGSEAHASDADNCGVCGIKCNASNGESCQPLGGRYFCRGCVASAACWSHCCSESFSPYTCAASDCAGNCSAQYCPPGTHCVSGGGTSSDYCSY